MTDDVACMRLIALEPSRRPGPLLTVPLDELQVVIGLDADGPLFLWQFARASDRFHEHSLVQEWSVLDTYAIYRDNDYSFYLSDDRPPTVVSVAVGQRRQAAGQGPAQARPASHPRPRRALPRGGQVPLRH